MPSRPGPKMGDWVSQMGIRDMYPPARRLYHTACPQVDLLKDGIKAISEKYYHLSIDDIRSSIDIRNAAKDLLNGWGPYIWSDATNRIWLFQPGQGASGAPYERHLYFSNPRDKEYLEKTLYGYVLAKVLRHHKDNSRSPSNPGDIRMSETPDLASEASYKPRLSKLRASNGAHHLQYGPDPSFPVLKSDVTASSMKRKRSAVDKGELGPNMASARQRCRNLLRTGDGHRSDEAHTVNDAARTRSAFQPISDTAQTSSVFLPTNASNNDTVPPTRQTEGEDSIPVRTRRSSFDSIYDVTPRPEAVEKRPTARSSVLQFKIWYPFRISDTAEIAAKAVRFDTTMSFDVAFAHARVKLERQLGGRNLVGMTIDSKVDGKPSLLVDEEDMWSEVLALVRDGGSEELSGTVDME
ncbi:uncharacterized protein RCC_06818 [Ramularia collo-cygni]|uniref:Uncharacterized protein n=1 Tax=Ramularia collo-cygni TaxID=112498 RepID=A0A2D3V867_9PEZI|nr:uncharacterized protein RCC_06818 [Ramularia collo-cygni]CZT20957.1 uncharacterized protein RCC_06818 [Ramularia collo-cygni]